jgi:hypothetical protein
MTFTIIFVLLVALIAGLCDKDARPGVISLGHIIGYYLILIIPVLIVVLALQFAVKLLM